MFSPVERMIALRYLRARRQEGFISIIAWFSIIGITLGVATLIIVMSVMNGFREDILSRILGLNGHVTLVSPYGPDGIEDYEAIAKIASGVAGVVSVTPYVEGQVMATANGASSGALVRGLKPDDFYLRDALRDAVLADANANLDRFEDGSGVIVGYRLARQMGLRVGDGVTLISPRGNATPIGVAPRTKTYRIAALFNSGHYQFDSGYIYMALSQAQKYFRYPERATGIELITADADQALQISTNVAAATQNQVRVLSWQFLNRGIVSALQVERVVMFVILTLMIFVAAFNIISSQIMLVNEKARGVAILRTMGASRSTMLRVFFMTGCSVGLIGTGVGSVLGVAFALNIETVRQWFQALSGIELFQAEIYFLSQLPAKIDSFETVLVIVIAVSLTLLASIYPAWRAARLDPVEVLRYE